MTLTEPKFGPWVPDPTPKVGSIWGYFINSPWSPNWTNILVIPAHFWTPRSHPNPIWTPGSKIGLELALRVKNWVGIIKKSDQIQVQANNLGKIPNLNPLLGLGQAARVQIWVQSESCWPSDSEFHHILQFQAVLEIFNQQWLVKKYSNTTMQ